MKDHATGTWRLVKGDVAQAPEEVVLRVSGILIEKYLPPIAADR
jgi:hypothetical protein